MGIGWLYLIIAGLCEGLFAFFLKISNGFKNIIPTLLFFIFYILSAYLLSKAIKYIPIGTADGHINTTKGPVIGIFHMYALHGKDSTIHSANQLH